MNSAKGMPSKWLLYNSRGFPDFLFTILTYSLILLALVSFIWIAFGILSFIHAGTPKADTLIKVMESMKTGLVSLAGVVFGLAGSYTVRRFKYDQHYLEKKKIENGGVSTASETGRSPQTGLGLVTDQEDI